MKQTKIITLILLLIFSMTSADAQIKGLLKKAKKVEKVAKKGKKVKNALKKAKIGSNILSGGDGLSLDWDSFNMTPAISFNSLLKNTQVFESGGTRLGSYTSTFVPYKKANGSPVDMVSDQDKYLKVKAYKGDDYITYYEYDGGQAFDNNKRRNFTEPGSRYMRDGDWTSGTDLNLEKWGEGMYRLDFYAGDKMFYTFDFEVYKLTNSDAYADINELYLTRGPWNDYVYLNHADTGNLIFGLYLNHEEFSPNPSNNRKTSKSIEWSLKMFKDNKLFAKQYSKTPNKSIVARAEWKEFRTALKTTDGDEGLKFSSLEDGAYKIELSVQGEAQPRIYTFDVKGNKIVYRAEQDRSKNTDPKRLVEGWRDYVWLKQEK